MRSPLLLLGGRTEGPRLHPPAVEREAVPHQDPGDEEPEHSVRNRGVERN